MQKMFWLKTALVPALVASLMLTACIEKDVAGPSDAPELTPSALVMPRALGALKDPSTALALKKVSSLSMDVLPAAVDLTSSMPPIGDQGSQGSCTSWAITYAAKTMLEKMDRGWDQTSKLNQFSPAWTYNQAKEPGDCGTGSHFNKTLDLLKTSGADNLASFPYTTTCSTLPDEPSKARALPFQIKDWFSVNANEADIKAILVSKKPVIIGINVLSDFDNLNSTTNTIFDDVAGVSRGYHAITIVGYDDGKKAFKVANSWGTSWGSGGYGWLAYSILTSPSLDFRGYYFNNKPVTAFDHSIYRWSGTRWDRAANGGGIYIASDAAGVPFVINKNGEIWKKNDATLTSSFTKTTGLGSDIGSGGATWMIGRTLISGTSDYPIFKWNGTGWIQASNGGGVKIAVDPNGVPWVINSKGEIWKKNDATLTSSFTKLSGLATDIGIGSNGSVWITGTNLL